MTETIEVTVTTPGVSVVGSPSEGDSLVFSGGQWVPGGGGGVTPDTVFEALLPLGKIGDPSASYGDGTVSLFDPTSTDVEDAGWLTVAWEPGYFVFGNGDLSDEFAVVCEAGRLGSNQGVFHVYRWNTQGDVEIFIDSGQTVMNATAVPGQAGSIFKIKDSSQAALIEVKPNNTIGFHGATPAAQSVAGTTAADAIACLKAHGLMAA